MSYVSVLRCNRTSRGAEIILEIYTRYMGPGAVATHCVTARIEDSRLVFVDPVVHHFLYKTMNIALHLLPYN